MRQTPRSTPPLSPNGRGDGLFEETPDIVFVGHVCRDVVPDGFRLGGTVTYAGLAAVRLGQRIGILTSTGPDLDVVAELMALADGLASFHRPVVGSVGSGAAIEVAVVPAESSTIFENIYAADGRHQFLRARAAQLTPNDVPAAWLSAPVVHLGPIDQELDPAIFAAFPRARVRSVTPQGWLRRWDDVGHVDWIDLPDVSTYLGGADAVILSEEDVHGDWDILNRYAAATRRLVVTHGPRGATLCAGSARALYPGFPAAEVDPTGAGDVFAAAYLVRLAETGDDAQAMRFASAAASFAVEGVGAAALPTREQVDGRLQTPLAVMSAPGGDR